MGKRKRYSAELRQELVRLVGEGRSPESLAKEFEPTSQAIRKWVRLAELDEGKRTDGLTTKEREELARLRRFAADLQAWSPLRREMLIVTRFGDTVAA